MKTLKRGGTYALSLAVETVTPRLQTLIEKDLDIPKTKRFIDLCYQEGILTRGFFMLGFPTETKKELLSTIWFALRSRLTFATFFNVVPQPETPMYDLANRADAEALARMDQEDYYAGRSWYELATGFPVRLVGSLAFFAFYLLSPGRLVRMMTGIPLWNARHVLRQFVGIAILGRDVGNPGRRRLRRFRPELELVEPAADLVRTSAGSPPDRLLRNPRAA